MKKSTKGALATGAAVLLLLGGAGSYAFWSDTDTVDAGAITAGTLDIVSDGPGTWTDNSPVAPNSGAITDIGNFLIVPGDELDYEASFTVSATGDNLQATVTGNPATAAIAPPELIPYITFATTIEINGAPVTGANIITDANNGDTVDVTVKVIFLGTTPDQVGQGGTVDLTDFQVTLQQTRG